MFDGSLPEVGDLAALGDAALVDAAAGWAQTENAACARKLAVMAEQVRSPHRAAGRGARTVVGRSRSRRRCRVGCRAEHQYLWMALAQAHRGVVLARSATEGGRPV